ncbi:hypothetical protein SLH49_08560 [Cognatiyoonia sp. IB215446]|uniref:hypothetical protein n=1 Tax=Cognatiyoonia sp. IB215446 TaxID=3097355 RepID=UPI002A13FC3A|nr:hypothetical protein [Cognatiyoonia sp. IB215446]MDX8348036.1 hypothetical protein [Cognatiyoonia sp. IB215446]
MKRLAIGFVTLLAACDGGAGFGGGGNPEFMVIGGRMSFEDCRSRGGLIIRDANTAMIACDPSVRGEPQPVDEFDNPANAG